MNERRLFGVQFKIQRKHKMSKCLICSIFNLKTPILACIESHLFTVNSCKDIHLKRMSRVLMLWLVNVSQYRHSKSLCVYPLNFGPFLLLYFYLIHVKEVVPLHYCHPHPPHVLTENI